MELLLTYCLYPVIANSRMHDKQPYMLWEICANAGMANICQCWYGKCLPMLVWEMFANAGLKNVTNATFGKYLSMLVWEMFANTGLKNVCKC